MAAESVIRSDSRSYTCDSSNGSYPWRASWLSPKTEISSASLVRARAHPLPAIQPAVIPARSSAQASLCRPVGAGPGKGHVKDLTVSPTIQPVPHLHSIAQSRSGHAIAISVPRKHLPQKPPDCHPSGVNRRLPAAHTIGLTPSGALDLSDSLPYIMG